MQIMLKRKQKFVLVVWNHYKVQSFITLIPYAQARKHARLLGDANGEFIRADITPTATAMLRNLLFLGADCWFDRYAVNFQELMEKDRHIVRVCYTGQLG